MSKDSTQAAWNRHERCEHCGEGHLANCPKHEAAEMPSAAQVRCRGCGHSWPAVTGAGGVPIETITRCKHCREPAGDGSGSTPMPSQEDVTPGCRCGLYTGACPLHDHDYRASAEAAIAADRAARSSGKEQKAEFAAIEAMIVAFIAYEDAVEKAQRSYHNYQEWGSDEWAPIEKASADFYSASTDAKQALSPKT